MSAYVLTLTVSFMLPSTDDFFNGQHALACINATASSTANPRWSHIPDKLEDGEDCFAITPSTLVTILLVVLYFW